MIAAYATDDVQAVVTWNPLVSAIMEEPGANKLFDSSDIPGEIIDLLVVNTETLEAEPRFRQGAGRRMVRADGDDVLRYRRKASPRGPRWPRPRVPILPAIRRSSPRPRCSMTPAEAVGFAAGRHCPKTMVNVAEFLFDKGILGEGAPSARISSGSHIPMARITGERGQRAVPLRHDLHADGGRRRALEQRRRHPAGPLEPRDAPDQPHARTARWRSS